MSTMAHRMTAVVRPLLSGLSLRCAGARAVVERCPGDIVRIALSTALSRRVGMAASVYRVGNLLVDTGFVHARQALRRALAGSSIAAICLTHHHEDHTGSCGLLARERSCAVYLRHAEARLSEGLAHLPLYRRLYWGVPPPFEASEMPLELDEGGRSLRPIPTPGHSVTHTALWDEREGVVLTGDLFVSPGASAVMSHENPYELVASLRAVADLGARTMLTGHGLTVDDPASKLRGKADHIEETAGRAVTLHRSGVGEGEIVRRLFPGNPRKERTMVLTTGGEFSRLNFVRAAIALCP